MKFWKENKTSEEFDMSIVDVVKFYASAVMGRQADPDWQLRYMSWSLDRALRDWLTHPKGLNASWENEEDFEAVRQLAHEIIQIRCLACCSGKGQHTCGLSLQDALRLG